MSDGSGKIKRGRQLINPVSVPWVSDNVVGGSGPHQFKGEDTNASYDLYWIILAQSDVQPDAPLWDSSVTYANGAIVTYSSHVYQSRFAGNHNFQPNLFPGMWQTPPKMPVFRTTAVSSRARENSTVTYAGTYSFPLRATGWTFLYADDTFNYFYKIEKVAGGSIYAEVGDGYRMAADGDTHDNVIVDYAGIIALAATRNSYVDHWQANALYAQVCSASGYVYPGNITADDLFQVEVFTHDVVTGAAQNSTPFPPALYLDENGGFPGGFSWTSVTNLGVGHYRFNNVKIAIPGLHRFYCLSSNPDGRADPSAVFEVKHGVPTKLVALNTVKTFYFSGETISRGKEAFFGTAVGPPPYFITGKRVDGKIALNLSLELRLAVGFLDHYGNVCDKSPPKVDITLNISDGGSAIPATVTGTLKRKSGDWYALFDDVVLSGLGQQVEMWFSSPGLTDSDSIKLWIQMLGDLQVPAKAKVGEVISVSYRVCDWGLNTLKPASPDLMLLSDGPKAGFFSAAGTTQTPVDGVAKWTGSFAHPGTWNLKALSNGATYFDNGTLSSDIVVTA